MGTGKSFDIQVNKGTYYITLPGTDVIKILFIYRENNDCDTMVIRGNSILSEITKNEKGFFVYKKAAKLRESLGELKGADADLPEYVKKVLEVI